MDEDSRSRGELSRYICGGYFIAKVTRYFRESGLLPGPIITASPCMAKRLPGTWAFEQVSMTTRDRKEAASNDGIVITDMDRLLVWTADHLMRNEIGFPDLLMSKKVAQKLLELAVFDHTGWHLLAIGLREDNVEEFLSEFEPPPPSIGGRSEIPDVIRRRRTPDLDGQIIGFEALAIDYGECHSWLCNSLEEPISAELGIRPGAYGLLPTWSEADTCAKYAARPEVGAEPLPWYAWALISYPI